MAAPTDPLRPAIVIAIIVPLALLAGAWSFQIWGGLFPCEMCWWQRYGHIAALVCGVLALLVTGQARRALVVLAGLGIASSAVIAGYHAGIEYGWWHGVTACTSLIKFGGGTDPLAAIMNSPAVRCDEVQWQWAGISLAGFNFMISGLAAVAIFVLVSKAAKGRPAWA
jgi:disulfide bond formation protein DsbB